MNAFCTERYRSNPGRARQFWTNRSINANFGADMTRQTVRRRKMGRPTGFLKEDALEAAMKVFWQKGYEGASLSDLTHGMGINRSSMYAAFGDKEALFQKVLTRYREGPLAWVQPALQKPTARD